MDRVRALLRTRNDYVVPVVTSDDPPIEVTNAERAKVRTLTPRERDAEIARLERMTALREGRVVESDKEWWERAKEQRDRSGSYQALDKALTSLTANDRWFLDNFYSGLVKRSPAAVERESLIVRQLASLMPDRIELPHGLYYQHSQKLVRVVRSLASSGNKISQIAHMIGVSRRKVRSMLRQTKGT